MMGSENHYFLCVKLNQAFLLTSLTDKDKDKMDFSYYDYFKSRLRSAFDITLYQECFMLYLWRKLFHMRFYNSVSFFFFRFNLWKTSATFKCIKLFLIIGQIWMNIFIEIIIQFKLPQNYIYTSIFQHMMKLLLIRMNFMLGLMIGKKKLFCIRSKNVIFNLRKLIEAITNNKVFGLLLESCSS